MTSKALNQSDKRINFDNNIWSVDNTRELRKELEDNYKLLLNDRLYENQICIFFELADRLEDYDKLFTCFFKYYRYVCRHFQITNNIFRYNIEHKWNGDLTKITPSMTLQQWKEDFDYYLPRLEEYKLAEILKKKIKINFDNNR